MCSWCVHYGLPVCIERMGGRAGGWACMHVRAERGARHTWARCRLLSEVHVQCCYCMVEGQVRLRACWWARARGYGREEHGQLRCALWKYADGGKCEARSVAVHARGCLYGLLAGTTTTTPCAVPRHALQAAAGRRHHAAAPPYLPFAFTQIYLHTLSQTPPLRRSAPCDS